MSEENEKPKPSALEQLATIAQGATEDAIGAAVGEAITGGDPNAIAGAAVVGALRGTAKKGATALARLLWDSPDRRLAGAVSVEAREHLELVAPIVEENAQRLLEDPDVRREDLASNTAAILVGWERAYRATGDAKKRRVIMAALGNAFRPELFKEGLTLRLFRILEDVDYPEIHLLREIQALNLHKQETLDHHESSLDALHLWRLREMHLVYDPKDTSRSYSEPGYYFEAPALTELGARLLALCADTEALNRIWPDPDAKQKPDA